MNQPRVKVLLVDDHELVRVGLATILETVPHFSVVGEAGSVAEAIAEARRCQPEVVLMDLRLPDGSGIDACRAIRSELPRAQVIMLTSYADDDAVVASITAGAAGYLLKRIERQRLIEAVETAARGGSLLDSTLVEAVIAWMRRLGGQTTGTPLGSLSAQERRILLLISEGKTNREIAAELSLSEHTVKSYVSAILQKLHLSRRSEAAALVARHRRATET